MCPAGPDSLKSFRLRRNTTIPNSSFSSCRSVGADLCVGPVLFPLDNLNTAISLIRKTERFGTENPEAGPLARLRVPENFI